MRVAYLDCFSGISGDMFLGALVDAGVSVPLLEATVAGLGVGASLEVSTVKRSGIAATKVGVVVQGAKDLPREVFQEQRGQQHAHEHRSLAEIRGIISSLGISERAKARATAIFDALGTAEARIHQVSIEDVHFHEVGAADALVDIVCAAVGSEALQVDEWVCSPLNVGGGTVECAHGRLPVPAPATLELLKSRHVPVYSSGIEKELVTPTGAALVAVLAQRFGSFPPMQVAAVGYGAGYRDIKGQPNVLRLTVGEAAMDVAGTPEVISVLEANLDDLNPQLFGYLLERVMDEGALEVFATPVQMKKNRPGLLLTVLSKPQDEQRLAKLIFTETTTLGVRVRQEQRQALPRKWVTVVTPWGEVRLKVAALNGATSNVAPEYEDCRRIAAQRHIPLKSVMLEAVRLYMESQNG